MPNDSVFNQSSQPLFTEQVNTYVAPGIDSAPEGGAAKAGLLFGILYFYGNDCCTVSCSD